MEKNKISIFILIIAFSAVLFFWNDLGAIYTKIFNRLPEIQETINNTIQEAEKQIITPPPLKLERESEKSFLTKEGVIKQTNLQRLNFGLPELKENSLLDKSADNKAADMFLNQYFAHESPSGLGVKELAESSGYEFIIIGENLALGNFENDEILVQAWMDSPGHRANILNKDFQEIGVSVVKGFFEGKPTWIAVQHFAKPLSACQQPDAFLKLKIQSTRSELSAIRYSLDVLLSDIQSNKPRNRDDYNEKVDQYNSLVEEYNSVSDDLIKMIEEYNLQVKIFNDCAGASISQ